MKNNSVLITIVVAVVVGAAAFFGGMQYQRTMVAGSTLAGGYNPGGTMMGQRGSGRFGGAGGGRPVTGKIISQDASSITVQLIDGSSKIVNISGSTTFSKTSTASASDLKTGDTVAAFGTVNSDGSITAQNVQLNPMFMMRRGVGRGSVTQQPTQ